MPTKQCTKCGEKKELSEFYQREISKNSFHSECKICTLKLATEYYQNNFSGQTGFPGFIDFDLFISGLYC